MSDSELPVNETPKKKSSVRRWLLLGAAVLAVALIVVGVLIPGLLNPDRLTRYFKYLGVRDDEDYGRIRFDSSSSDSYAVFDGHFAVGCADGLYLYDDYGEQLTLVQGSLPYPKLCTCDGLALCYSSESSTLLAIDKKGKTVLSDTADGMVFDAELSEDGCVCYAASGKGCKTLVTVMNKSLQVIYKWNSYSRYLNCCAINDGAQRLAVVGLDQKDSVFCSTLSILRTDSEDDAVIAEAEMGNQLIYELYFTANDRLCAVGEQSTLFFDTEGHCLRTVDYEGLRLTDFTVGTGGTVFLSFENGKDSVLVSLDADGGELARKTVSGSIQSLSANGKYLAVLTQQELTVFSEKLAVFDRTAEYTAANRALARKDGTVLLVSNGQTQLYIP